TLSHVPSNCVLCFTPTSITAPLFFFFNDTATTDIYTLSLHDALPISSRRWRLRPRAHLGRRRLGQPQPAAHPDHRHGRRRGALRSEEHTSELQSRGHLVCRLLLEKKNDCAYRNQDWCIKLQPAQLFLQ